MVHLRISMEGRTSGFRKYTYGAFETFDVGENIRELGGQESVRGRDTSLEREKADDVTLYALLFGELTCPQTFLPAVWR